MECGRGTNGEYTANNLPDGKHTFEVNAVDGVGNKGIPKVVEWTTGMKYSDYNLGMFIYLNGGGGGGKVEAQPLSSSLGNQFP